MSRSAERKLQIQTRTTSSWSQGLDPRSPRTGPATKTTRRTSDGPLRPSLSVATSWCQGLDPRGFPLSTMATMSEASTIGPQTDLAINDRNAQEHQHRRGRSMPEPIRRVKNIPQKKSYSLAGVFRYWLGAIRSIIDAAILDIQSSSVQFKLGLISLPRSCEQSRSLYNLPLLKYNKPVVPLRL